MEWTMIGKASVALVAFGLQLGAIAVCHAAESAGEVAFNTHCRNCHSFKPGDHRLGPSLHGIVGDEAGAAKGFANYSGALAGFTWDEATLHKFMSDPVSVAPGTTMIFPPVKDQGDRQAIIDFLKSTEG